MVRRAAGRNPLPWVSFAEGNATALPEAPQSYDVIVSTQVAEYVADIGRFCAEAHRVLKAGGRGVIMATDWDSIVWHSDDPARMQRVLKAYAPHSAHSTLPRTLAPHLRDAGFRVAAVSAYAIINTDWADGRFSREMVRFITGYILGKGSLPPSELEAWEAGLRQLAGEGRYFFALNRYFFLVERPSDAASGLR
jgi:SAM-dependent methyltransferase